MYCGNNRNSRELTSRRKRLGNRYDCFRKGVGVGMNLPLDREYARRYVPIVRNRVYCGKDDILPQGYHHIGNLFQCLQKGVGVGKRIKARRQRKSKKKRKKKRSR